MARATSDRGIRRGSTRRIVRTAAVAVLAFGVSGFIAACEPAPCTATWAAAGTSGAWDDPASWSGGTVPGATDIVCIGAGWDIELPAGDVTVKGLKLASTLHLRGTSFTILNSQMKGASTARFSLDEPSTITIGGGTGELTLAGGELRGVGTVNGSVSGASSVSPGSTATDAPGVLTITGDLIVDTASIPVDLSGDGKVPGVGHDQLKVNGSFEPTAATSIIVRPAASFAPSSKTTMPIVAAGSETGSPQVYDIPDFRGTGKWMDVSFVGPGLSLFVTDCDPDLFFPYWTYSSSLAGKDLRLCQPYTSTFDGIDLTGVDFAEAILWDSSFAGSNLTNANFFRTDLGGVDLGTATLAGVRSGGTVTTGVVLPAGWAAIGGYLVGPGANLTGAKLPGADLTGVRLAGTRLTNADLSGANLAGVDLTGATLTGADLSGADLTGAKLSGVASRNIVGTPTALPAGWALLAGNLIGPGANLTSANLNGLDLSGFDLTGANLTSAQIGGTNFTGATFQRVRARGVTGTPTALPSGWVVRSTFLAGPGADLTNFNLGGLNLSGINLSGADLTGSSVSSTNLNTPLNRVRSGGLSGTPAALPFGWQLRGGFLVGPGADFSGKTLAGTNLASTNLSGADFTNATLVDVTVTSSNWTGALANGIKGKRLVGAPSTFPPNLKLANGWFIGPNVNLSGETVQVNLNTPSPYTLAGANLTNAAIVNSDLFRVSLANANLTGAVIADTFVDGVNMTGANMGGRPVGATFGTGLRFRSTPAITPPAGWQLRATGAFGTSPYELVRVS